MTYEEFLAQFDTIAGLIGSDDPEEIENAVALLTELKMFAVDHVNTVNNLSEELGIANEAKMKLRMANNDLFRKINSHEQKEKEAIETLSTEEQLAFLID